jgi:hypothetical protein
MRKIFIFVLFATAAFGQAATPVRSVATLPATCTGGSATTHSDEVMLITAGVGQLYTCTATNTWTPVGASVPGVAVGSAFVSNGVGQPGIYQSKPVIDALDQGVTTTGDQTTNLTNAWNLINTNGGQELWRSGTFQVNNPISPASGGWGYKIGGSGGSGSAAGGTILHGNGATSSYTIQLDRNRDCTVGDFNLNLGVNVANGIIVTQNSATSLGISSHCFFHDFSINNIGGGANPTASLGFRLVGPIGVTDSGNNNEAHVFWRPSFSGVPGGTAFYSTSGSSNARGIGIYEPEVNGPDWDFFMGAGSWHVIGGLTESALVSLIISASGGGYYGMVHDELSKQGIVCDAANNSNGTFIFEGLRYEADTPDLTKYWWDLQHCNSNNISIGNWWNPNASMTKMVALGSSAGRWTSIADKLPNTTLANLPNLQNSFNATNIGTANEYSAGIAEMDRTGLNPGAGDGDGINGLWIGTTDGQNNNDWYNSPGSVIAGSYTDGGGVTHIIPYRTRMLVTDATGTSAVTMKVLPMTDPVTSTTYAGKLNEDHQTNVNNFLMNHAQATDVALTCGVGFVRADGGGCSPITPTQFVSGNGTNNVSTTASCSTTLSTLPGDTVVFIAQTFAPSTHTFGTPSDGTNTYLAGRGPDVNGNNVGIQSWYAPNVAGGSITISTAITGGATFNLCIAQRHAGLGPNPALDGAGATSTGNVALMTSGAATTTKGSLIIGYGGQESGSTLCTAGTGFTQPAGAAGNLSNGQALCAEYNLDSAGGSAAATQTNQTTQASWVYSTIAFRPSIGVSGPITARRFSVDNASTLASGAFILGAGWGSTASIAITNATSKDSAYTVTITTGGTGIAANPTLQITFADGTWTTVPVCSEIQSGGNDIFADTTVTARSATSYTYQYNGTPTTGKTYELTQTCTGT